MDEDDDDIVIALRRGEGCWEYVAADEIEALRDENTRLRNETLEEAAQIAEKVRDDFLSEEYVVPQPIGSLQERFACDEVAAAIRAAMGESDDYAR